LMTTTITLDADSVAWIKRQEREFNLSALVRDTIHERINGEKIGRKTE
jgi:hypothetical protein